MSDTTKTGFFGWKAIVQNMSYEVKGDSFDKEKLPKEELIVYSPDKEHDIAIPQDTLYTAGRLMSKEGNPIEKAKIDAWTSTPDLSNNYKYPNLKYYLAFAGTPVCKPEFYKQYLCVNDFEKEKARWDEVVGCFPIDKTIHCETPNNVYVGEDGKRIAGDFLLAANKAAGYYSAVLDGEVEEGNVKVTYETDIDDNGAYRITKHLSYVDEEAEETCRTHKQWKDAQRCDKYIKDGGVWIGFAGCAWYYNYKDERRTMIGKDEPEQCPTKVSRIGISDAGDDGTVDSAGAEWAKALGDMTIDRRSDYTAPLLDRFTKSLEKASAASWYRYWVSPSVATNVSIEDGDSVCKGEKLFTYQGDDDKLYGVYARANGTVKNFSNDNDIYFEITPSGYSIGCWLSGAYEYVTGQAS